MLLRPTPRTAFPAGSGFSASRSATLRYGENPHQRAAMYVTDDHGQPGLAGARQLQGKEMSYNNYVDADAAWRAAHDFDGPAVAVIKHANPCGVAVGDTIADAHAKAHATDPMSAFGGVIAANGIVTADAARSIAPIFTEVVVAPGFEPEALEILSAKKNLRVLEVEWPARRQRPAPHQRGTAAAERRSSRRSRRLDLGVGAGRGRGRGCGDARAISSSRGARAGPRSRMRSCWRRMAPRWASAWGRSTASTRADLP